MEKTESQLRHEQLIDFLSGFKQYQIEGKPRLKKVQQQRSSDKLKDIDSNDINTAVVVLADTLNLGGGSIGDVDLYTLLQAYLAIPEYRSKFNEVAAEAKNFDYRRRNSKN